jgi:hypothetical protein
LITGYSIILEDDILYCSNEDKYTVFEIVLFVEKLIRSINPTQSWRLNNINFQSPTGQEERIILKHLITDSRQNLFYCILGTIDYGSTEACNILEDFYEKTNQYYQSVEVLKHASKKLVFKEILRILTDYLQNKYEKPLELEKIKLNDKNYFENKILYCGISSQGLPIISQLYDKYLLNNLNKEINAENIELFNSNLSAHLATIEMNTIIRGNLLIKEIHIDDFGSKDPKKTFIFTIIQNYSLDIFASGDFNTAKDIITKLTKKIAKEKILQESEFTGDLKPYKHLQKYFDYLIENFHN